MSAAHRLELTSDALAIIQEGLAALRGLYEMEANYGRQDLRPDMMKRL